MSAPSSISDTSFQAPPSNDALAKRNAVVLAAARETARQTRADVRQLLFGKPRQPEAVGRREPATGEARTLGSSTTALTKD